MTLFNISTISWPIILTQLIFASVVWKIFCWFLSPIRHVPGPISASWTRLWHIVYILRGDQNLEFVRLHAKHGPFVRIAPDEVSVGHPDAIHKLLKTPLHKGYWYKVLAIPDYRFQSPASSVHPREKRERSKHFAPGFSLTNVLQSEEAIDNTIQLFLSRLNPFVESGEAFHLDKYFSFLAFDTIGEILFSKQFGFLRENRDIGNTIGNITLLSAYAAIAGFVRPIHTLLVGNPFVTWLGILPMGHLFTYTVKALDERLLNDDDRSRFDAVSHWSRALQKNPDKVQVRDVYSVATGAVGAGSETVSCSLQSFVYHMGRHPNAWERVRNEMDEAVKKGLCQHPIVSFQESQELSFLQACIKEAIRVFSPTPMGLPRVAPKGGITIGDQYFPAGTILSINAWVIHHNKGIWGDDAQEFNPDRWLGPDAVELDKYFMAWGHGYASCPGQHIAKIELSKVTATLVRDYEIYQENPTQDWKWEAHFTVVPHSWPCKIRERKPILRQMI